MHPSAGPLPFALSRSEAPGCAAGIHFTDGSRAGALTKSNLPWAFFAGQYTSRPVLENDL